MSTLELCIKGGAIIDGSGTAPREGDVGIRDGRIVELGEVKSDAAETIDAAGLVVAPGFVDMHTHYDAQVFWDPTLSPSGCHGYTTIVGGNCGFSIAPLSGRKEDSDYLLAMLSRVEGMPIEALRAGVPWDWTSFAEYLSRFEGKVALNAAFMVGHSAIRRCVMGERARERATDEDLRAMQELLGQSLAEGGFGFSTTIAATHYDLDGHPVPSRHASREELLALARVVRDYEGTTLEIAPDTDKPFAQDVVELMCEMSLAGQRPINWNSLAPNSERPEVAQAHIKATDYATARGARIVPLVRMKPGDMRLNFQSCMIMDSFPGWDVVLHVPPEKRKRNLADPAIRARMKAGARTLTGARSLLANWDKWRFAEICSAAYKPLQGKLVSEAAKERGVDSFDLLLDVAVADDLRTSFVLGDRQNDIESWRARAAAWRDPRTIVGASDAGAHLDMLDSFAVATQLLSLGVRDRNLLSLEEAVRQLTSVPAALLGLRERGTLRAGYWADVVVFDPQRIAAGPAYTRYDLPGGEGRLFSDPAGVEYVLVNGRAIVRSGKPCAALPGKVLRSGRDSRTASLRHPER